MVTSKNSVKGVFAVSRLCAFFFINRYKTAVGSSADSDTDVDIFEDKNYGLVKPGKRSSDWSIVVMNALKLVAECEDDVTELIPRGINTRQSSSGELHFDIFKSKVQLHQQCRSSGYWGGSPF